MTESDESHITPAHASEDASSEKNKVISRILMNVMPPMIFEAIGHIKVFFQIFTFFTKKSLPQCQSQFCGPHHEELVATPIRAGPIRTSFQTITL